MKQAVAFAIVGLIAGLALGRGCSSSDSGPAPTRTTAPVDAQPEQQLWTCSMHPQVRATEAGPCPLCGMDLIPLSSGGDSEPTQRVALSEAAAARAQIRTTQVTRAAAGSELRLLGKVDYDETRQRTVTSWLPGRIDRLRVKTTGARVSKGQVIATLYSPDVYGAFGDLVGAVRQARSLTGGLHQSEAMAHSALEAARQRLRLLGVTDAAIGRAEDKLATPKSVEIRAPFGGTVIERLVDEGQYVKEGAPLFRVADLSRVWVQIDAYENDLPQLAVGQQVHLEVTSLPGETFTGSIAFIDPVVDEKRRTARVRVEVPNPKGQLRPGMFADAIIHGAGGEQQSQLVIPASAPLFTGRRSVVYVAGTDETEPSYTLRVVQLGPRASGIYPVLDGLQEGERVVTHGAFVLDADLQLSGGRSMMGQDDDRTRAAQPAPAHAHTHEPETQTETQVEGTPSPKPAKRPKKTPARAAGAKPTSQPTAKPTSQPTAEPTSQPTAEPTSQPAADPHAGHRGHDHSAHQPKP